MYAGNTGLLTNGVYAEAVLVTMGADPDGTSPGFVLNGGGFHNNPSYIRYILSGPQTTVGMALRFWVNFVPNDPNQHPEFFQVRDASNNILFYAYVNTVGGITVASSGGTVLGSTAGPVVTANAWWHIESKIHIDPTAGSVEIRVEGVPVLTLTGINTGTTAVSQVALYQETQDLSGLVSFYKDFVIWDGSGTNNNDFLGSVVVYSLTPNADVSVPWSITGGTTGYGILDNAPPQDDVQYLSAAYPTIPGPMSYTMTPLPNNVTSVRALMSMVRAKKVDGGDGNLQNSLISGTNTVDGQNRPITAAYTYWRDVFPVDPDTGNPWTVAAANAVKLKINRTS